MSKVLIVDDADPAVAYSGSWSVGTTVTNTTNEYRNTFHKSSGAAGDELSYAFYGTGISLYGTLDAPFTNGLPSVTFTIDTEPPTAVNATGTLTDDFRINTPISHVPLFQSPILSKGQHTLFVKTSTPTNPAARLYVDFLTVSTGSDSVSGDIAVDDRDISIAYTGNWVPGGAPNEYNGTTRQCPDTPHGGTATFSFNGSYWYWSFSSFPSRTSLMDGITGTAITIFGTTPSSVGYKSTPQIGFDVDGVRSGMFTGPSNAPPVFHTPFFHVEGLSSDKEHTVVIETLSPSVWFLDYVVYTTGNSSVAGGGGGGGGVGEGSGIRGEGGGAGAGAGVINLGPIIGVAVAGCIGLLAIFGIICILLRRRRGKVKDAFDDEMEPVLFEGSQCPPIVPFTITSPTTNQRTYELQDTPHASHRKGGILTASKYNRGNAIAAQLPNESAYAGIGTSTYSTLPESHDTENPTSTGQEAGSIPTTYHSASQPDGPSSHNRATIQSSNEKAQFKHAGNASNTTRAVPIPYPLMVSRPVEEDSGIRIPVTSPPLYTPH